MPASTSSQKIRSAQFRPEAVGVAALAVLALICVGLIGAVILKTESDADRATREAAAYTPPLSSDSPPAAAAAGPAIAIVGDGGATRAAVGIDAAGRWPSLLRSRLSADVILLASPGVGYTTESTSGATFLQQAADVPKGTDVVVFFGGAADASTSSLSLAKAATIAFADAKKQSPDAKLVVVGPVSSEASPDGFQTVRSTLRGAAAIVRAQWVDPIQLRWLSPSAQSAAAASGLSAADESIIAARMRTIIEESGG